MILDFLFPKTCLECKKEGVYICKSCQEKVLSGNFDQNNFSIFKYRGVVKKAIIALKYKFATDVLDELVDICIQKLNSKSYHNILLIPIPLHWQKENSRGFNQSRILGEEIAKKMSWSFNPDLLLRPKPTKSQSTLSKDLRKTNIYNAFILNPEYKPTKDILNCNILLFDDVYTTGSTIREAKKTLNYEGFKNIYSLTIAR
jgi:competence protein ComFC